MVTKMIERFNPEENDEFFFDKAAKNDIIYLISQHLAKQITLKNKSRQKQISDINEKVLAILFWQIENRASFEEQKFNECQNTLIFILKRFNHPSDSSGVFTNNVKRTLRDLDNIVSPMIGTKNYGIVDKAIKTVENIQLTTLDQPKAITTATQERDIIRAIKTKINDIKQALEQNKLSLSVNETSDALYTLNCMFKRFAHIFSISQSDFDHNIRIMLINLNNLSPNFKKITQVKSLIAAIQNIHRIERPTQQATVVTARLGRIGIDNPHYYFNDFMKKIAEDSAFNNASAPPMDQDTPESDSGLPDPFGKDHEHFMTTLAKDPAFELASAPKLEEEIYESIRIKR